MNKLIIALSATFLVSQIASADIQTTFLGVNPSQSATVVLNGVTSTTSIGPFNFLVNSSTDSRFSGTVRTFCADLEAFIAANNTYTYTPVDPTALGTLSTNGATKAALLNELFDRFYDVAVTADLGGAFQLSVWEIIYDGGSTLNINDGSFQVTSAANAAPIASNWLASLDGGVGVTDKYDVVGWQAAFKAQDQLTVVPKEPNPVPAPAGVILGLLGTCLFATRRYLKKAHA